MNLRGSARSAVIAMALAAAVGSHAGDGALVDYRAGIEAFDQGRWQDVVDAMRRAIEQDPRAGSRVKIYGMRLEVYLPYYHLGYALDELGDCPGAVEAWEQAERQGAVRGKRLEELVERREACRKLVEVSRLEPNRPEPNDLAPAVADDGPTAEREPQTEEELAAPIEDSRPDPEPAATLAMNEPPPPAPAIPAAIEREVVEVEEEPTSTADREARSRPPPTGPPEELRSAATAFFGGDPGKALGILEAAGFDEPRARRIGLLLAAASRYALYRAAGGADDDLLQAARDDVAHYRSLPGALEPDARWFSPSFRRFFADVKRADPGTATG